MIKIKVNKNLGVHKKGDVVTLSQLTPFWRRRLKDAALDFNCEIMSQKGKGKKTGENKA